MRPSESIDAVANAREQFLAMVADIRPELHRYCSRLTGSVIEGEDIVQEALARAFYALALEPEAPALRAWLFRIAHNAAIDFLKRHGHKYTDLRSDIMEIAEAVGIDDAPDPAVVRAAIARFLGLPLRERSAVILKDVLGQTLEETAETMGATVMAVKAALVRGRSKLRDLGVVERTVDTAARADLDRYAALFNARDWDGVRAIIRDDCRLDLVSKSQRRGKSVSMYFERYEQAAVVLRVVSLEGQLALAAHVGGAEAPSYFILLEWVGGQVSGIRDFRYVPYIAREAAYAAG
jgi:RNA polymerase sigma factor (sigma-70 family)